MIFVIFIHIGTYTYTYVVNMILIEGTENPTSQEIFQSDFILLFCLRILVVKYIYSQACREIINTEAEIL